MSNNIILCVLCYEYKSIAVSDLRRSELLPRYVRCAPSILTEATGGGALRAVAAFPWRSTVAVRTGASFLSLPFARRLWRLNGTTSSSFRPPFETCISWRPHLRSVVMGLICRFGTKKWNRPASWWCGRGVGVLWSCFRSRAAARQSRFCVWAKRNV